MFFWNIVFGLFFSSIVQGQPSPKLRIVNETKANISLSKLKIDVKVTGNLATTTIDLTYFNPTDRQLEGEFYFPLGKGQTVSRFALDVEGHLREGVVVEKARGTQIFEEVVRKEIDPGLLEMTRGNNFKARIYPIPANGYKRLVIAYEQELEELDQGYLYRLPLQFEDKVKEFSLRVTVFKQKVKPVLYQSDLTNIQFENWQESYVAELQKTDYQPNQSLSFVVPAGQVAQNFVFKSGKDEKDYFYVHLKPEQKTEKRSLPRKVVLLWDVSSSARQRDLKKELDVLDRYFKAIKNGRLKVVTFSNELIDEKEFSLKNGNWQALQKFLKSRDYDGGTQLGVLDLTRYDCDEFILCSDGQSNIGREEIKISKTPVVALNSSVNANHAYLQFLASATSGRYLDLTQLSAKDASQLLLQKPFYFMKAVVKKGSVKEILPSRPQEVLNDFSLAGELNSQTATIELQFGDGRQVLTRKTIQLNKEKDAVDVPIVRRIWAQKKLYELSVYFSKNEDQFIQLAKDFGIVTPLTSLLVLDRLEDYLQYHIVPPEKELQEQYFARLEEEKKDEERKFKKHLEWVVELFKRRIAWWENKEVVSKPNKRLLDWNRERIQRDIMENRIESVLTGDGVSVNEYKSMEGEGLELSDMAAAPAPQASPSPKTQRAKLSIKKWDPQTPYLKALKSSKKDEQYAVYLTFKKGYENSPSFYFDVADFFVDQGQPQLALRVLTNLAELELENHELLRILAYRLIQLKAYDLAVSVLRRVLKLRPFEPQSYRDLALALQQNGQYQEAVDLLYKVVTTSWDSRFPEIELIALEEMNNIIFFHKSALDLKNIDQRLIKNLPLDLRIVMTWDADNTDIDLWVIDPNKEKCYYQNRYTKIGGLLSQDFTQGYGPEEFLLREAIKGTYQIKSHFFGNHRQDLTSAVTIFVDIFTHYGTKQQSHQTMHLRLESSDEVQDIGSIEY